VRVFLYQRLMTAYSIRFGVVLLPLALLAVFILEVVYGSLVGGVAILFALVVLSRFFMSTVFRAISEPVYQLLFQPIPTAERILLQTRIEGGPKALGVLLTGLLLLGLRAIGISSTVELSGLFLGVLVFWVVIAFRVPAQYRAVLGEAVARSVVQTMPPATAGSVPALRPRVNSHSLAALGELVVSASADDRARAARELGQSGRFYAYQHLLTLLADPVSAVREAAITAAGVLRKQELWPQLFGYLNNDEHAASAGAALGAVGEPVMPLLSRFFNRADLPVAQQVRLVAVVGTIGGDAAKRFLRFHLNHPLPLVREQVVTSLARLHHRATGMERPPLLHQLDETVAWLLWLIAARLDLADYSPDSALLKSLDEEAQRVVPTVFRLLSILYGNNEFDVISELITQKNSEIHVILLELLGNILPDEVRDNILPLFADVSPAEQLRLSATRYPQQQLGVVGRLRDIINKDYAKLLPRTKALALRELLAWPQAESTSLLVASAAAPDAVVAEMALYVLYQLNPARFAALHATWQALPAGPQHHLLARIAAGLPESELLVHQLAPTDEPALAAA
jgi:hypothetical protein